MNDPKLPPEIEKKITQAYRDGVQLEVDWEIQNVAKILWIRHFHPSSPPADYNALAEAILKHVTGDEMPLEIDGEQYLIRKTDDLGLR